MMFSKEMYVNNIANDLRNSNYTVNFIYNLKYKFSG